MTTRISTQKVIAVLKKADLKILSQSGIGSGYSVHNTNPQEFITVTFKPSKFAGSYTESKIAGLDKAVEALNDAGISCYMRSNQGDFFYGDLIVWRDLDATVTNSSFRFWNTADLRNHFADRILQELQADAEMKQQQASRLDEASRQAALRLETAKSLNPTFQWVEIAPNMKQTVVTLNDGRKAAITIGMTLGHTIFLNDELVIKLELVAVMPDKHDVTRFDSRRESLEARDAATTVNDLVYAWIAERS